MNYSELVKFIRENSSYLTDQGGRLSRKYGVSKEDIKKARQEIRESGVTQEDYLSFFNKTINPIEPSSITLTESNTNVETGEIKHVLLFDRPLTKEELEAHFHVDNINNKITNYWSILVKSGAGYATSVNIKNIAKDFNIDRADAIVNDFIKNSHGEEMVYKNISTDDENLLLLNIADFHIDKENIDNNDIQKRIDNYISLLRKILELSSVHKIDKILYVVGNDYFNTDTILNTTTKGTPQNVIMNWDEAFKLGFDLQIHVFRLLQLYCDKIDILHVSGNHDETKSYYLAYSLSRYFESSSIRFLIDSKSRKQYSYGSTFFGFHHGNTAIDKLPLNFSKQYSTEWGAARYHEIVTADKHHYKQYELEGVRIHQMPSLTGVDNWHDKNNFNNSIQSALGMMYNSKLGKFAEFEVRLDDSDME